MRRAAARTPCDSASGSYCLNRDVDAELLAKEKIGRDNFYINVPLLRLLTRPASAAAVEQVESVPIA